MAPSAATLNPTYYTTTQDELDFWSKFQQPVSAIKDKSDALPNGFPLCLESPLVWDGATMAARENEWIVHLNEEEVAKVEEGLKHFKGLEIAPTRLTPETFPLPLALRQKLDEISHACHDGRGFCIVRGINPKLYTDEDNTLMFMGISAHVAPERGFQDRRRRQILCHVVNAAANMDKEQVTQPGFTDGAMSFHNDECEVLALYVMDTAASGGRTQICSAWQVYNTLAQTRPDIIKLLAEPWTLDTFRDFSEFPPQTLPFLHVRDNKVMFCFSRYPLTGFGDYRKRSVKLPPVTDKQLEALNALQILASHNSFPLPTKRGDILYMNDVALVHGRQGFDERGRKLQRHLIKLCLRDPKRSWPVPAGLQPIRDRVFGPNKEDGTRDEECCLTYYLGQEKEWSRNG